MACLVACCSLYGHVLSQRRVLCPRSFATTAKHLGRQRHLHRHVDLHTPLGLPRSGGTYRFRAPAEPHRLALPRGGPIVDVPRHDRDLRHLRAVAARLGRLPGVRLRIGPVAVDTRRGACGDLPDPAVPGWATPLEEMAPPSLALRGGHRLGDRRWRTRLMPSWWCSSCASWPRCSA